jgi:hypothetical protein
VSASKALTRFGFFYKTKHKEVAMTAFFSWLLEGLGILGEILLMLIVYLSLFLCIFGIPLFFITSLALFLYGFIKNKVKPQSVGEKTRRVFATLLIVSFLLLVLVVVAIVAMAVLLMQSIAYM